MIFFLQPLLQKKHYKHSRHNKVQAFRIKGQKGGKVFGAVRLHFDELFFEDTVALKGNGIGLEGVAIPVGDYAVDLPAGHLFRHLHGIGTFRDNGLAEFLLTGIFQIPLILQVLILLMMNHLMLLNQLCS